MYIYIYIYINIYIYPRADKKRHVRESCGITPHMNYTGGEFGIEAKLKRGDGLARASQRRLKLHISCLSGTRCQRTLSDRCRIMMQAA